MTKQRLLLASIFGVLIAVLAFAGERVYRSSPTHKTGYSTDLKELRARFNTDKAKVRLLMLLSPT